MIGKGGSSRVYEVLSHSNQMFVVKRVSLDRTDQETMSGYMNDISLLKRLEGNHRITRLIDSEVRLTSLLKVITKTLIKGLYARCCKPCMLSTKRRSSILI